MMRRPSTEWRIIFLAFCILCGLGGLIGKLWWEQVARGKTWTKKIASRSEVTVRIPAVRGEIRDRNGVTLVANRASYEVDFYLPDMVRGYRQHMGSVPVTEYLKLQKRFAHLFGEQPDLRTIAAIQAIADTNVRRFALDT